VWVPVTWFESLKTAVSQWYAWGLLSIGIYWINRLLPVKRDNLLARFLIHAPLSLLFTVAYTYLNQGLATLLGATVETNWIGGSVYETLTRVTYRLGTFVYWAIAAMCVALDYQSDLKDRQIRNAELERLLSEARLSALRTQLDPHFLFNTLNAISAYVESKPREARMMLEQLGDLMRMSLDHADAQEIPLERELAFVDRYVQLQRVRFDIDVGVDVEPEALSAAVPTFILQPLIENAIRHGVSQRIGERHIDIAARREHGSLRLQVRDNGRGLPAGWELLNGRGIGLRNTQARLQHMYDAKDHELRVGPVPGGVGTQVDIRIPFRLA
jgi:LytS/YehU family sensor histidine kinase